MLRYFFDSMDSNDDYSDVEGILLPDSDAAQRLARRALCEIARDCCHGGPMAFAIRVRDLEGREVYRVSLTMADTSLTYDTSLISGRSRGFPIW